MTSRSGAPGLAHEPPAPAGWRLFQYAGHAPALGGGSPLRSRESEPCRRGKGVTARWGLKEARARTTP